VIGLNKPAVSKLLKLKQFLTVPDAAKHLTGICGEEVAEADIYRFALDGYLKLSIYMVNKTHARRGHIVHFDKDRLVAALNDGIYPEELKWSHEPSSGDTFLRSICIGEGKYLNLDDELIVIDGVWDLPMIGGEMVNVEHEWHNLTNRSGVTLQSMDGAFVQNNDGVICQLQERFGFYGFNEYQAGSQAQLEVLKALKASNKIAPEKAEKLLTQHKEIYSEYLEKKESMLRHRNYEPACGLPEDTVLVVRTEALREFEQILSDNDTEEKTTTKPHGNTEHNAQKREQVLRLAFGILATCPEDCTDAKGAVVASKTAAMVDVIAPSVLPDGEPPLATDTIAELLRECIREVSSKKAGSRMSRK
jgi:hypothetical protein